MPGQGHRPCSSHMSLVDLDGMLPPHMFWWPEPTSQVPLPTGQLEGTRKASAVTVIVPTKPTKISSEGLPTRQGALCYLLRTWSTCSISTITSDLVKHSWVRYIPINKCLKIQKAWFKTRINYQITFNPCTIPSLPPYHQPLELAGKQYFTKPITQPRIHGTIGQSYHYTQHGALPKSLTVHSLSYCSYSSIL